MSSGAPKGDDLSTDAETMGRSVERYADKLHTAQAGAERAKQIAQDAGLVVTDTHILAPGPAPSSPQALSPDATSQDRDAHGSALAAVQAHEKKATAYAAAKEEADRADSIYEEAKKRALDQWQTTKDKWYVHAGEFVQGGGSSLIAIHKGILGQQAERLIDEAKTAENRYLKSPGGSAEAKFHAHQQQTKMMHAEEAKGQAAHADRGPSTATKIAGRGLAVGGVAWDISSGKPPGKAIFSGAAAYGGASLAVGAATTLLVSNPVGWAALGVGALGVGGGVVAGMAGDALWDAMPDGVTDKIDQGVEDVGSAIGDTAKSTWDALF